MTDAKQIANIEVWQTPDGRIFTRTFDLCYNCKKNIACGSIGLCEECYEVDKDD